MAAGPSRIREMLLSGLALPGGENMPVQPALTAANANDDDDADPMGGKKGYSLDRLKRQYRDFIGAKADEFAEAKESDRYYHGAQWTDRELAKLDERNQPAVTFNRVSRKINGVVGLVERLRQDPKAYPRNPGLAEDAAELATQCLMYVLDTAAWRDLSPECGRKAAIRGIGGVELVLVAGDNGDPDVSLEETDPREFFYDPRSSKHDFRDARFMGTSKWMDSDDAASQWPDSEEDLETAITDGDGGNWSQDDRELQWINISEKQVRVVDHWYKRGQDWFYCIYSGDIKLEEGISPFRDEKGQTFCKYFMFSNGVDHDNDRYGFFRDLKSPQDEINHRRSKALHALNTRRIIMTEGAVSDVEKTRREVAKPDGVVVLNPTFEGSRFDVDSPTTDISGNVELLAEAKAEIENFGPNPALIGQGIENKSGRAIALLQQAGIAELGPFIIAYRGWKMRVYRGIWNALKQFWTAERWIRVTDNEDVEQFIQINGLERDEYGRVTFINQIGSLDVDIVLDEGPDNVNSMADSFDLLLSLAQSGAQVPPEILIELSALPSSVKKRVMAKITQGQNDPMQQAAVQLKMEQEQAKLGKTQAETQLTTAKALETHAKTGGQAIDNEAGERVLAAQPFTGLVPPGPMEQSLMGQGPGVEQPY
jgi:hypothetical protein